MVGLLGMPLILVRTLSMSWSNYEELKDRHLTKANRRTR